MRRSSRRRKPQMSVAEWHINKQIDTDIEKQFICEYKGKFSLSQIKVGNIHTVYTGNLWDYTTKIHTN